MIVQDYLDTSGLSEEAFAERVGIKSVSTLRMWKSREMPPKWAAAIENSVRADPVGLDEIDRAVTVNPDDPEPAEPGQRGRQSEHAPQPPPEAKLRPPAAAVVKLATVRGYVVMIYDGGARMARQQGDALAAETIERYTPEFADAWVSYLESKPEILAWLSKLQVGTPLGNLIGVHVIATGSYVLARQTGIAIANRAADDAARAAAEQRAGSTPNGTPSFVGDPEWETL